MHGDTLCTDDKAYQRMRKILRHRWFKKWIVRLSKARREAIGLRMRQSSKQHSQQKSATLMDVTQQAVCDAFKAFPTTLQLIHGHTHRPKHHIIEAPHATLHRWVLGDWRQTEPITADLTPSLTPCLAAKIITAKIMVIEQTGARLLEFTDA
jgi:UDP-2,3-diacylglucosamine hydrolase